MSAKKDPDEKIGNVAPFGLRMLPELRMKLDEAARHSGRSMNSEISARLEQTFQPQAWMPADLLRRIERAAAHNGVTPETEMMHALLQAYPAPESADQVMRSIRAMIEILKPGMAVGSLNMLLDDLSTLVTMIADGKSTIGDEGAEQRIWEALREFEEDPDAFYIRHSIARPEELD